MYGLISKSCMHAVPGGGEHRIHTGGIGRGRAEAGTPVCSIFLFLLEVDEYAPPDAEIVLPAHLDAGKCHLISILVQRRPLSE
jgi:hypothetical protein